jgi:hypothetical protein
MRKTLILLTSLLLAGCIDQSGSYYISDTRDHALTVRAEQDYFWDDKVTLTLVASHFPECQRALPLAKVPKGDVQVELFSNGDGVFTVRVGTEVVQVDTQTCTRLADPAPDALGEGVGVFSLGRDKMEFNLAVPAAGAAAASAPPAAPDAAPAQ